MAVQPWESCLYTAEEERDFVKNYLGPTMVKSGLKDKKILIWDHNRSIMYHRAEVVLDDPKAAQYVWGVAFHWYVGNYFENVKRVQEAFPKTHLLFTEGCNAPFDPARIQEWQWGETYGISMINDFNNGAVGWTDWNVLLDQQGGPNHVHNYCFAPIHANTETGELTYMSSYYYLGHFSKFVRPGARRIISSSTDDDLLTTAFLNKDGTDRGDCDECFGNGTAVLPVDRRESGANQQPRALDNDPGDLIPFPASNLIENFAGVPNRCHENAPISDPVRWVEADALLDWSIGSHIGIAGLWHADRLWRLEARLERRIQWHFD